MSSADVLEISAGDVGRQTQSRITSATFGVDSLLLFNYDVSRWQRHGLRVAQYGAYISIRVSKAVVEVEGEAYFARLCASIRARESSTSSLPVPTFSSPQTSQMDLPS